MRAFPQFFSCPILHNFSVYITHVKMGLGVQRGHFEHNGIITPKLNREGKRKSQGKMHTIPP